MQTAALLRAAVSFIIYEIMSTIICLLFKIKGYEVERASLALHAEV